VPDWDSLNLDALADDDTFFLAMIASEDVFIYDGEGWRTATGDDGASTAVKVGNTCEIGLNWTGDVLATVGEFMEENEGAIFAFDDATRSTPIPWDDLISCGTNMGRRCLSNLKCLKSAPKSKALTNIENIVSKTKVSKNSLDYVGETHVYSIKGPNGYYKIGESADGVRLRDGASIRAEKQARKLRRTTGNYYETQIRKVFPNKRLAREYEKRLIERYRRMFGERTLPGNKTNR
jgi:hypothetical protein